MWGFFFGRMDPHSMMCNVPFFVAGRMDSSKECDSE